MKVLLLLSITAVGSFAQMYDMKSHDPGLRNLDQRMANVNKVIVTRVASDECVAIASKEVVCGETADKKEIEAVLKN